MASGETTNYSLPYPILTDTVNVHGDIQSLAEQIDAVLPTIGLPYHTIQVTNTSGVSITKGDPVYITGYSSKPTVAKSDASNLNTFPVIGLAQATMANNTDGVVIISGVFSDVSTTSFPAGSILYVATGGGLTITKPASGSGAVGVVAKSNSSGTIIVGQPKGNGTWGSLKAGLA